MTRHARLRVPIPASVLLAVTLLAGRAHAACALEKLLELPVTMTDMQPLVPARLNGRDALFLVDSGAVFSTISAAKSAEFGLKPGPAPFGYTMSGVGGAMKTTFVSAKSFSAGDRNLTTSFVVGGSDIGHDAAGLIGQNILGVADVEYDLAHGAVRVMRPHDCVSRHLAYWAEGPNYSVVEIEAAPFRKTIGVAAVNGVRIRVEFDSGAQSSTLTTAGARRIGLDPHAPGVVSAGVSGGVGRRLVQTWIAPVDSFKIGDEDIRHTRLRLTDTDIGDIDMLLGADFFLSHRIYVANDQRKVYFTYNGGPVFNLEVAPIAQGGTALPAAAQGSAAEPSDAAAFARRGTAFASRRQYEKAIADLTRAVDLAPTDPSYLFERARAYQGNNQPFLAMADLDKSLALKPDDIPALATRAAFHLAGHDKPHALSDLAAANGLAPRQADVHLELATLYERANEPASALGQLDLWIAAHPEDGRQAVALNERCWTRALWNQALDLAAADCTAALKRDPTLLPARNSRGLVRLRQGDADGAIADFNADLAARPDSAWSLYGRGLARLKKGQSAEGKADLAAATALRPGLDAEARAHGLAP
ncbi:MAG TPA: aspartyl protease family protein [Caulobacteraceae bacterium]|nr:aspartyl protease family protein [Caulobacteraceae bacterium]